MQAQANYNLKDSAPNPSALGQERVIYLDLLRIFAMFCMMLLHVAAANWSVFPVESFEWRALNVYDSLVRFSVPVFIMISGSFFLDPDRPFSQHRLFSKNILRIVTAFSFWSALYALNTYVLMSNDSVQITFSSFLQTFALGSFHLWFLYALVILYILVPIMREFIRKRELCKYFLIVAFMLGNVANIIVEFPQLGVLNMLATWGNMHTVFGYMGYYALGYYLKKYEPSKPVCAAIYALGAAGVIVTILGTSGLSAALGAPEDALYNYLNPNVYFAAAAVFLFFKQVISRIRLNGQTIRFVNLVSACCFGMYLCHDFFNKWFKVMGFTSAAFNPVLSVPIITLAVFVLSFVIAYGISKIPVLNRYIM